MKRFTSLFAVLGIVTGISAASAGGNLYWDNNGAADGLWTAPNFADGTWDTATNEWAASATPGTAAPVAWNNANNDIANFVVDGADGAPGSNAAGPDAVITVGTAITAGGVNFDNGWTHLSGSGVITVNGNVNVAANGIVSSQALSTTQGTTNPPLPNDPINAAAWSGGFAMGANTITLNPGSHLSIPSVSQIGHAVTGGGIVLDNATLSNYNPSAVGVTFYSGNANITLGPSGIGYIDVPLAVQTTEIYNPVAGVGIKGTLGSGATTLNGGAGTLVKTGAGEIRMNQAGSNTFAKLVVMGATPLSTGSITPSVGTWNPETGTTAITCNTGEYRYGSTLATPENAFGAFPLAPLADAITLNNGGMIGTSVSFLLHPNRGVVIGSGGGGTWVNGSGSLIVPGVVSGSGPLFIQGTGGSGTLQLENPNNTWTGDLIVRNGFLNVNGASLVANEIRGINQAGASGTLFGTVNLAPGKSLTAGSDNQNTAFDGRVTGAQGTFNKVGTGTLTLNTWGAGAEWTNLGAVNINAGTIQLALSTGTNQTNAGFGSFTPVTIASGAFLDMNTIQDTFGGLNGAGSVINHNAAVNNATNDSSNLNIRGWGTYNFSGTIAGSGQVVKNGPGTQTFSSATGNPYTGGTRVYSGKMYVTNTSGSGLGSGAVQVGTSGAFGASTWEQTGTLGGTGSVDGAITVANNGHLTGGTGGAPSNAFLTANGGITMLSGGSITANLGAPGNADHAKSTLLNGVTTAAGGLLTLNGASSSINGTYTVFEHNGYASGTVADFTVNNATGFDMASPTVTDTGTAYTVSMTNTAQNRTWAASPATGNWSAASADQANFTGGTGGQPNGPGAAVSFGASSNHAVTITDSNKIVGSLDFNDATSYTIAASNNERLVMDTYGGSAAISLTSGSHTISAPLSTNKATNVTANGNTLSLTGGVLVNGGSSIVNTGSGTIAAYAGPNAAPSVPGTSGVTVKTNGKIENAGAGSVTFTANGSFSPSDSATIVSNSVNVDAGGKLLNSGSGSITINLITTANLLAGATATTRAANFAEMVMNGTVENSGSGTLTINHTFAAGAPPTITNVNPIVVSASQSDVIQGAGTGARFVNSGTGTMTVGAQISNAAGVTFSNSTGGTLTVSGVLSGGIGLGDSGRYFIEGPGTTTFSASNTFTGGVVLKSGKLQISADNRLGGAPSMPGSFYNNITFDGGTLRTNQGAAFSINANRGMYVKSTGGTLENGGTGAVTFGGDVIAEGNFTKTGSAGNTLSGTYLLNSNGLRIDSNANTLTLSGNVIGKDKNVTMGGTATTTVSAAVSLGTGSLTKDGSGTVNLTTAAGNTMGGATISAGRLNASNTGGSAFGTGAVAVGGTGTLGGVGSFTGAASINAGGKISPGANNAIGVLGTGALTLNTGSYAADLNSTVALASAMDIINANGGLNIVAGSALTLADLAGVGTIALAPNTKLTLASYSGAWNGGIFNGLPDDTGTITAGANTFTINYNDTSAGANGGAYTNFVTLTTPATLAGDYSGNGKVSAADYVTWRKDPATFNGDPAGYVTWRENFDVTAGSGAGLDGAAVPEPSSIALVLLGIAALAGRRGTR